MKATGSRLALSALSLESRVTQSYFASLQVDKESWFAQGEGTLLIKFFFLSLHLADYS